MHVVVARFRSFRSPPVSVLLLLLGLAGAVVGRSRLAAGAPARRAATTVLDSTIAAATPTPDDTTDAGSARIRTLVAQKRDVQVEANRALQQWLYWSLGSSGLVLAAIVTGGLALISHLRDGPAHATQESS